MALALLEDDIDRDKAVVSGREIISALPMPTIEAQLRAEFEANPERPLRGLLASDEDDYLAWALEQLHRTADVPFALIGELHGEDWDRVRTLQLRTPDGPGDNFEYDLLDTPCYNVIGKTACIYPDRVAALFPHDLLLAEMGVESYAGLPLFDPGGRPLGLIILLDRKSWPEQKMREALGLMIAFRSRIQTILINRRARRDMELLSSRLEAGDETDPIGHLTRSFARAMNVKSAFVSTYTDDSHQRMQTVALAVDGQLLDGQQYELSGTPMAEVDSEGELLIRNELSTTCTNVPLVAKSGACSYLVMSLSGVDGQPIAHLGLMHDRPLHGQIGEQPVVRAFKERFTFELRRQRLETERLATERQVLELQRTESLGILAGGIAHDFNNLLVGVLGNADLALLDFPESGDNNETHEYLVDIRDAARSAMELCRQMLAYAGRAKVESKRLELGAEVNELSRLLAASVPRTIEIVVERPMNEIWINADPVQIRQVLMNLITNAGDAIGDTPGKICVSLSRVSSSDDDEPIAGVTGTLPAGDYACLSVRDDGCGMNEATLERIFDPFFTTKQAGHGLGLAAMLGVVRDHGGTFRVSSELGVGTHFRVYLPEVSAEEQVDTATPERPIASACVLVVDDDPRVRKVASRMLQRANYRVITAVDGLDAIARYEQEGATIDCILLDLGMPKLGGIETMQRLRAINPEVRVIVSSGYSGHEALSGDDDSYMVVHKPYEVQMLINAVAEILDSKNTAPSP